jgi:hypothetical protein
MSEQQNDWELGEVDFEPLEPKVGAHFLDETPLDKAPPIVLIDPPSTDAPGQDSPSRSEITTRAIVRPQIEWVIKAS